jgi:peptidyl-prolyl cis-trans isomerase SurA
LGQNAVLKNIQKDYGFSENVKEKEDFYSVMDSSYFKNAWTADKAAELKATIFTIGDKKVNQQDFANFLEKTMAGTQPIDFRVLINEAYIQFKNRQLLSYKDKMLESEFPEFKALVEEYHDGILLFNLTDDLVWRKASEDTTGLENFFEQNIEDYKWKKRAEAVIYTLSSKEVGEQVKKYIKKGLKADSIMKLVNETSQLNMRYEKRIYEEGTQPLVDQTEWKKGNVKEFPKDGRVQLVEILEVYEPGYKKLSESRGLVISDYQEFLEKEWIKELREKYNFEVDQEVLEQLKGELN